MIGVRVEFADDPESPVTARARRSTPNIRAFEAIRRTERQVLHLGDHIRTSRELQARSDRPGKLNTSVTLQSHRTRRVRYVRTVANNKKVITGRARSKFADYGLRLIICRIPEPADM